jgi:hypothetical protein
MGPSSKIIIKVLMAITNAAFAILGKISLMTSLMISSYSSEEIRSGLVEFGDLPNGDEIKENQEDEIHNEQSVVEFGWLWKERYRYWSVTEPD